MSDPTLSERFEELEAGRILGDLDADEVKEWEDLAKTLGRGRDLSLELVAAAVETEFVQEKEEPLPSDLAELLRQDVASHCAATTASKEEDNIIRPAVWQRMLASPEAAWATAAVLTALLIATFLTKQPDPTPAPIVVTSPTEISPEYAKSEFLKNTTEYVSVSFDGKGSYEGMKGDVVWSDETQEGYLTLTNLPVNDPNAKQYQLWVVDPSRDDEPVDGGVFDIPADKTIAVVPINCPLKVSSPRAFVITLEQPGGVVVSKQEEVVALAAPS